MLTQSARVTCLLALLLCSSAIAGPDQPWLDDTSPGRLDDWKSSLIALALVLGVNVGGVYIWGRWGLHWFLLVLLSILGCTWLLGK